MARKPFYSVKKGDSFFSIAGALFGDQRLALELKRFLGVGQLHAGMRIDLRGFKPSRRPFIGAAASKEFGFATQYDDAGNAITEGANITSEFSQELPGVKPIVPARRERGPGNREPFFDPSIPEKPTGRPRRKGGGAPGRQAQITTLESPEGIPTSGRPGGFGAVGAVPEAEPSPVPGYVPPQFRGDAKTAQIFGTTTQPPGYVPPEYSAAEEVVEFSEPPDPSVTAKKYRLTNKTYQTGTKFIMAVTSGETVPPVVHPDVVRAAGLTDKDMRDFGYVIDEDTGMWIDIAAVGTSGSGSETAVDVFNAAGGSSAGGAGGIRPNRFSNPASRGFASATGGLVNWRIGFE